MRFTKIRVTRSPMSVIVTDVLPWEPKILKLIHGDENVEVLGTITAESADIEPRTEYERLVRKYAAKDAASAPYAVMAYGTDPTELSKVIAEELAKPELDSLVA